MANCHVCGKRIEDDGAMGAVRCSNCVANPTPKPTTEEGIDRMLVRLEPKERIALEAFVRRSVRSKAFEEAAENHKPLMQAASRVCNAALSQSTDDDKARLAQAITTLRDVVKKAGAAIRALAKEQADGNTTDVPVV